MFRFQNYAPLLIAFLLLTSCTEEGNNEDFNLAKEELDIFYGSDQLQTYDLYLPANRSVQSTDVIILIHGGGWVSGDKKDIVGIIDLLQTTMPEYAIVNMNYRLNIDPNNPLKEHMADITSVVQDITSKNEELGVSKKLVMIGVSAGAHMTLLYSYAYNTNNYIKIAASIVGPTYFLDPSYTNGSKPTYTATITILTESTGVPLSNTSYYQDISPIKFVSSTAIPTIQFLGDQDPLIPQSQGTLLEEELNNHGVANELIIYPGEGHGWTNPDNWTDTAVKLRTFVQENL